MAWNTLTWLWIASAFALATQAASTQCYYPNGDPAPDTEKPCSSASGSACCPDNWECLDNGLCHYAADNLFGRYSCTDENWNSPGCASNLCTYGMTLGGGESITQCSDHNNNWCCNGDAQQVNCCKESPSPRPFFALQDGKAYATIGSSQAATNPTVSTVTGLASGTASSDSVSQISAASSNAPSSAGTRSASAPPMSHVPFTSVKMSLSSGTAGVVTVPVTVLVISTSNPTATTDNSNNGALKSGSGMSSKLGVIVGCAVGIPLALVLLGIIIWMLRKRHQQKSNAYQETPDMNGDSSSSPGFTGGAAAGLGKKQTFRHSSPGTPEIDSQPVGPGQPISTVQGHAELESGTDFQPGHGTPYAPDTVGLGGGNGNNRSSWGSIPPQYSPGAKQTAFHQHAEASELDGTTSLPIINEKVEPQQHLAYRPPASQQPVAELPAVKTPPEDLERKIHH